MRAAVAAFALVPALLLTGCAQWFLPPPSSSASVPTNEETAPGFEPYYHQVLTWERCGNGKQCSTAIAPLDWSDPEGERIELALVRQPATSGSPRGSLLVNPGGPGGSGYDFVLDGVDFATDEALQAAFDVVGFDPRGVGRSTPVSCYEDPAELDDYLYAVHPGLPGSEEWLAAATAAAERLGARCLELTGPLLGHVDTVSAARDLDMLRAALGDAKLNYLGYSYGTLLGQVFADLFPDKTGRLVFDGAVDPAASEFELTAGQARGFEGALVAFLRDCLSVDDCPFSGSADAALASIGKLFDTLDASPLRGDLGRQLNGSVLFSAVILPLYNTSNWPLLRQLFGEVMAGDPEYAFELADSYHGRNPDGTYRSNQTEAFTAIRCLDERGEEDPATLRSNAEALEQVAPVLGPRMAWGLVCQSWPVPWVRERRAVTAPGSAEILVVGTTGDPATPYDSAVTVAGTLEHGHLVSYDGHGHTAYNKSNACVNDAVDDFLIDGVVPASDPEC